MSDDTSLSRSQPGYYTLPLLLYTLLRIRAPFACLSVWLFPRRIFLGRGELEADDKKGVLNCKPRSLTSVATRTGASRRLVVSWVLAALVALFLASRLVRQRTRYTQTLLFNRFQLSLSLSLFSCPASYHSHTRRSFLSPHVAPFPEPSWLLTMADNKQAYKRVVVKVGSSILVENQKIASSRIAELCRFVADLQKKYQVIIVTSGAVAAGYTERPLDKSFVPNKQALASLGQPLLMHMYYVELQKYGILCSQLLLGAYDFDSRKRTINARNAIEVLLANHVVPIINENDATALRELVFGDNDRMSAHVAYHFDADLLVILSDIDGYYTANPRTCQDAKMRLVVNQLTPAELQEEATPNNQFATGGIVTKLQAAQFLLEHGKRMFLSSGLQLEKPREFLLDGTHTSGTLFCPPSEQNA
jgi:glutamate 5-kinase